MRKAYIIIGASYGDEGKGLATAWLARRAKEPCLNIMINGGAQRGHTVESEDGRRHVFHHFGSATFAGGVSCADEDFIVNPLLWRQEQEQLQAGYGCTPRLLVSARCRTSTLWDMMLGQIIEENRGRARHGSCGCGIQETRLRYLESGFALPWGALTAIDRAHFAAYCRRIRDEWIPQRLKKLGMACPEAWKSVLAEPALEERCWEDLLAMRANTETFDDWPALARAYPALLFEAGQGLALDMDNRADFPHLTPSHTTSLASVRRLVALNEPCDAEVVYVTRSYLTRHGAGPLPGECPKEAIDPDMQDLTNVPNPHQETLRYAPLEAGALRGRILRDLEGARKALPSLRSGLMITHLNEAGGALTGGATLEGLAKGFDRLYLSDTPYGAREERL